MDRRDEQQPGQARRRALVTGATGFIGRRLVHHLCARGDEVSCLLRPSSDPTVRSELSAAGARLVHGDITAPETLPGAVEGADVVYHLASLLKMPWKRAFSTVNEQGTGHVAAACADAATPPVLVVVSSLAAAGPSPFERPRTEADAPAPVSTYGRVKLAAEQAARQHAGRVPLSVVRPPMVHGGGDRGALGLFRLGARGLVAVPQGPEQRVALVHVDDLAAGLAAVADRGERVTPADGAGSGVYHLAHERLPTTAELGAMIARAFGREPLVLRVPRPALWLAAAASEAVGRARDRQIAFNLDKLREITAGSWTCDVTKARRQLDFVTGDLRERLRQTAHGYEQLGWL